MARGQTEGASFKRRQELSRLLTVRRWGGGGDVPQATALWRCGCSVVRARGKWGPAFPSRVGSGAPFLLDLAQGRQTRPRHTPASAEPQTELVGLGCLTFGINTSRFGAHGCWGVSGRTASRGVCPPAASGHAGPGAHVSPIALLSSLGHVGALLQTRGLGRPGASHQAGSAGTRGAALLGAKLTGPGAGSPRLEVAQRSRLCVSIRGPEV